MSSSQPRHPFTIAWATWQAWSDAEAMRTARRRTAARGASLAVFDQHPEWTQGPGPLQALRANREVVDQLVGWRWAAMREAREHGHGWTEIGAALGVDAARPDRPTWSGSSNSSESIRPTQTCATCCAMTPAGPSWPNRTMPTAPTSSARPAGRRPSGDRRAVHRPAPAGCGGGRRTARPATRQARRLIAVGRIQLTIEVDDGRLDSYEDAQLAMCWHLAQANPAPHGDRAAGELVERIGREIIRRWLQATPPELWRHQGRDHSWQQLRQLATFTPGDGEVDSPAWHDGAWVPRAVGDQDQADRP